MIFKEGYGRVLELVASGLAAIPLLGIALAVLFLSRHADRRASEGRPQSASLLLMGAAAILAAVLLGIPVTVFIHHRESGSAAAMLTLFAVQVALWYTSAARADRAAAMHSHGAAAWSLSSRWPFLLAWAAPAVVLPLVSLHW